MKQWWICRTPRYFVQVLFSLKRHLHILINARRERLPEKKRTVSHMDAGRFMVLLPPSLCTNINVSIYISCAKKLLELLCLLKISLKMFYLTQKQWSILMVLNSIRLLCPKDSMIWFSDKRISLFNSLQYLRIYSSKSYERKWKFYDMVSSRNAHSEVDVFIKDLVFSSIYGGICYIKIIVLQTLWRFHKVWIKNNCLQTF